MKRIITFILALTVISSLTACHTGKTMSSSETSATDASVSLAEQAGAITPTGVEFLYGKITSIVGNEIEVSLANLPEPDIDKIITNDSGSMAQEMPSGSVASVQFALPIDSGMDEINSSMEFTGETATLTLPAGVPIYSMGQQTGLSSLKKGTIVTVTVDNLEDMNVQMVEIME